MVNKTVVGFLILAILSASFYVVLPDKIRTDVENTRTKYSVYEDGKLELAATEYFNLFDGSAKMRAKSRNIEQTNYNNIITITRTSVYKDNITTIQTYTFDGSLSDVESVPVTHIAQCINCLGKIVHFEYRDILYTGETKDITSPFEFGHNMKLEWQEGSYRSKVYQQSTVSDKIIIRYRPESNDETYNIKLIDPLPIFTSSKDVTYIYEECKSKVPIYINVTKDVKVPVYETTESYDSKNGTYFNTTEIVGHTTEKVIVQEIDGYKIDTSACPEECLTKVPVYDNVTKDVKVPIYENVSYDSKNDSYTTEIVGYTTEKVTTEEIVDYKVVSTNCPEETKYVEGVIIDSIKYDGKVNFDDKTNTLSTWEVPIGDRNLEEFGRCRDFEIEKGVCNEVTIK